jgi:cytochrome c-type biogenesis protein CcmH
MSLLVACAGSDSVSASTISKEVVCPCGCGKILNTCDCETAGELTPLIERKLAQGQSKGQILQSLVDQYGEQVLVR